MINLVWLLLLIIGGLTAAARGQVSVVTDAVMGQSQLGLETVLGFTGIMILWMGIMKIADESGLIRSLSLLVRPLMRILLPEVPVEHPAMGAILMNVSANLLGVGAAATPLGLKAMSHLQELNPEPERATDAMCTFLALNTSGVTLVPATVIALRMSAGSVNPTEIVGTALVATLCSSITALSVDRLFRWWNCREEAGR
ncbi:MAG: nucleoside recognition domain-containing protein [Bacillota bacterium]